MKTTKSIAIVITLLIVVLSDNLYAQGFDCSWDAAIRVVITVSYLRLSTKRDGFVGCLGNRRSV